MLSSRGVCVGLITPPEEPIKCGVSECHHKSSIMSLDAVDERKFFVPIKK